MSGSAESGAATAPVPAAPLRVLVVTNLWPTGNSFRGVFVQEQVAALRRRGHQVDVEVIAQGRGKADYLLAAPRVRRLVATGGYQLVHAHYGLTSVSTRLVGVPRVLSLYGSDVNARRQRWFTRLGWGGTAARIYVSRRLAATAGDRAGRVIPNGVDFGVFTPGDRAAARAALGLDPDAPVVLFGALPTNPVKCYDIFTEVLAALRERGVPARELVLSAPGQGQPELVAKFTAADVLLFTSRQGTEGSPTVVKEACVMGLPVVSVDVGDVAETLAAVTPSAVVEFPGDRPALVARLADATAAVLAAGTRSDGRTRNAGLESDQVAARIEAVYREVLSA